MLWAALSMTAALAMTACTNDDSAIELPAQQGTVKTIPYTVTVGQGEAAGTRATVASDMKTLYFAAGDKLYVTGTDIKGVLEIEDGVGTASATFSGDLTYTGAGTPASNLSLTATLVSAEQRPGDKDMGAEVTIDPTTNAVTVNYPTNSYFLLEDAVEKYSNLTGTSTYGAKSFKLSQHTAFLNFMITFKDGTKDKTSLSAVVSNNGSRICSGNVITTTEEGEVVSKFVLPVAAGTTLNGATVTMGYRDPISFGANQTLEGKVYNVKKTQVVALAVDLGLSVKWASTNLGAGSATGYGLFFAWGETTGYSSTDTSDGHNFSWVNTPYYTVDGTTHSWSKYASGPATLAADDDAATAILRGSWRMPTLEEVNELVENTDKEWVTNYNNSGVSGYRFTSTKPGYTDMSIFLPAAGYRTSNRLYDQGSVGYYWSSSHNADADAADNAHILYFAFNVEPVSADRNRFVGFPIRPVLSSN